MITGTAIEYSWAVDSSTPSGSIDNYTEMGRVSADTHTTVSYSYNSGTVWNGGDVDFTSSATIDSKISVMADTTLTISEGATLTLNKGMIMASGATLTVEGGGTLIVLGIAGANGKYGNAAIIGKTVINGATVNVTGGSGKNGGNGITGNVVLNSGALRAVGGAATTGSVGTAVAGTITKNDKTIINKVNSATESIVITATVSKPLCETYGDGKSADAVITGDTTIVVRTIYTDADNNESDTAFTAAGTYTATIYGADNSTASVEYTIKQKDISCCTISAISEQKYTGAAITPAVTVKDGSDALKVNTDYTVAYSNNKNV